MLPVKHNIVIYGKVSFMVCKTLKMELIQKQNRRRTTVEIHQQVRGVGDKYWIQNKGNTRTGR